MRLHPKNVEARQNEKENMNSNFDELAEAMAHSATRRAAINCGASKPKFLSVSHKSPIWHGLTQLEEARP